jgi:uncharacterized protein (DUF433 family)
MDHNRIVWDPKIMSGKPVIKGTRIPVETILRWLGKGETVETLVDEYPSLTREDIQAAQTFAADLVANERVVTAAE